MREKNFGMGIWIKPDITLTDTDKKSKTRKTKYIIDTKWKVPNKNKPSSDDLKQMFVYNIHFGARLSCLVYPHTHKGQKTQDPVPFETSEALSEALPSDYDHSCQVMFFDLFDKDKKLDPNAAEQIYENLKEFRRI